MEIVRGALAEMNAWNTSAGGDVHELLCRVLHEDVEWHDQRELPGASVHHGIGEVEQHLMAARDALAYEAAELLEIFDADPAVLAHLRVRARGRASGVRVERDAFYVYRLRDARIERVEIFGSRHEALDAVSVEE